MEITQTPQAAAAAPQPGESAPQTGTTTLSSDFETFIKMLTVQMQNQDPLNPMESSEFAVQLATFSSVEQQVQTNALLTTLNSQIGALGVAQLSGWVGMEARVEMPVVFDGTPVPATLRTDPLADAAELVVRDAQGAVVSRRSVSPEGGETLWAGTDSFGNPLPAGTYTLTVESYAAGEPIAEHPAEIHTTIVEARNDSGEPVLIMEDGQAVTADRVLGLRAPDT